jgi:hypothetical protein
VPIEQTPALFVAVVLVVIVESVLRYSHPIVEQLLLVDIY